MLTAKGLTLI